ncbi:MAG: bifunctional 5,10-methylenetetrahydrofolate dehydrogenase/5,10-methenyltetrahydrofolate cyclohydrolase [Candidatus Moraniibacteriota bacterium]
MNLLYGRPVADAILEGVKGVVAHSDSRPGLAVLLVGDDPASHLYVSMKEKAALSVGIHFVKEVLLDTVSEADLISCIEAWNEDENIHGILVQVPLPMGFDTDKIIAAIDPKKDVDGFHPETVDRFLGGDMTACPVFPRALMELFHSTKVNAHGLNGVALVNSEYFGRVMMQAMENEGIVPRIVLADDFQKGGVDISDADIVFSACGIPSFVRGHQVKDGVVIIDGGIAKQDGKIVGDVDAESVTPKASFLSPVPGGVGPVTIACLLRRTMQLAER